MENTISELNALGQSVWYDNMDRRLVNSGELERLISLGVSGVTSNPTIFEKAITGSDAYDDDLRELSAAGLEPFQIYEKLVLCDIAMAAGLFRPVYDRTGRRDGYVSLEPRPALAYDTDGTVDEIRRLYGLLERRPNVMLKVPGTAAGISAVETLLGEGININITLMFSLRHYEAVSEAFLAGLEKFDATGGDVSQVESVASFFVSRVDTSVDRQLAALIEQGRDDLKPLLGQAGVANAKLAYARFREKMGGERFAALREKGARPQRVLWASTSTKNPAYNELMYVEELAGADTVNTMPTVTLEAFLDRGKAAPKLETGLERAHAVMEELAAAGIDMEKVTDDLQDEGVRLFSESLDNLVESLRKKSERLRVA